MSEQIQGTVGVAPPPGAPVETSIPFSAHDSSVMLNAAREKQKASGRGEAELAPLNYERTPAASQTGLHEPQEPKLVPAAPGYVAPTAPKVAEPTSDQPAASDSDSPSRGIPGTAPIPAARATAPLQVVGGFGQGTEDYYPLDGRELLQVARGLLDEMNAAVTENDLRFHISKAFDNVNISLTMRIECDGDHPIVIEKFRRETDPKGNADMPPDAMRAEFGLNRPFKRRAQGPGKQVVDVVW